MHMTDKDIAGAKQLAGKEGRIHIYMPQNLLDFSLKSNFSKFMTIYIYLYI